METAPEWPVWTVNPAPGHGDGQLIDFQTFHQKAIVGVQAQSPTLVAPHIEQPTPPRAH